MQFHKTQTIDGRVLWLNLERITSISWDEGESICLVEVSGSEPHQISAEEFKKMETLLVKRKHASKK